MADHAQRLTRSRRRLLAGIVAGWLAIAVASCHPAPAETAAAEQSLVVTPRPFAQTLTLVGTIQAGASDTVAAPFDGTLASVSFTYGQHVRAGQVLATLDTVDLMNERNGAEADYLKAQQAAAQILDWSTGPEMAGAKRAQASAAIELQGIDRDLAATRLLLDKGLVPRAEYDALVQRRRNQQLAISTAAEDYRATLQRGQGSNRRIASLDLARARAHLVAFDRQLAAATIRATSDGVLVSPPRDGDRAAAALHVGSRLAKGQLLASIVKPTALTAAFNLDEVDVNRITIGQRVTVTGPAFDGAVLPGLIASVGGEAIGTAAPSTKASFAATARLDPLPPALSSRVRIGMTATITIETYAVPAAIVVPAAAVDGAAPRATVAVRTGSTVTPRVVEIGQVAADGVEIRAGLKAGDVIVWREAPATTPAGE